MTVASACIYFIGKDADPDKLNTFRVRLWFVVVIFFLSLTTIVIAMCMEIENGWIALPICLWSMTMASIYRSKTISIQQDKLRRGEFWTRKE